jgi:hypothetical protein
MSARDQRGTRADGDAVPVAVARPRDPIACRGRGQRTRARGRSWHHESKGASLNDNGLRAAFASARVARVLLRWLLALVACAIVLPVHAQADDALRARVGRIANVQGTLYHSPDDNADAWSQIGLNYPIAQGDNLWVGEDGRAEVDYGGGQFRLATDTNVHVSRLDERQLALFIASGRIVVRVRVLEAEDSVRVDTPTTQVALRRPGLYRIDVDVEAGRTTLIVREGEADVATAAGSEQVLPGQTAALTGQGAVAADIRNGAGIDGFDTWSAERDRVYEQPRENAYVSREMVGAADLDTYGTWQTYPDYGAVWFPTVDPEWAPYRFGRWTWLPDWGYAWVDDAPWGYAPFHYGRWARVGGRWGWCPGAYVARPSWAPALVAWYGGGGLALSTGFSGPIYGWVPLGWREPFVPGWRGCTSRCYARYNRPYAVNVAERPDARATHYANWNVPGGMTAVPAGTLSSGRPVAINRVPIATYKPIAPPLTTTPPAVKPAPVRPGAVRPGRGVPLPASAYAQRATIPPATLPARGGTIERPRVAPGPPRVEPSIRPMPAAPAPPVAVERSFHPAPAPAAQAPTPPPVRFVPPPARAVPTPQAPAPPAMRVAPAPQAPAPPAMRVAPAPPALAPPPVRVAPPPPAPAAVPAPPPASPRAPAHVGPVPPVERPN